MALLHRATLTPTKLQLLAGWLPGRTWFTGAPGLERIASYRFDDPAGEVGLDGLVVGSPGGPALHVPLTYRHAPLAGAEEYLLGTAEHSVLGTRWVYDGCGDPVWVRAAATMIATGGPQAEEYFEVDGRREVRTPTMAIVGSGTGRSPGGDLPVPDTHDEGPVTVVRAGSVELAVARIAGAEVDAAHVLTGTWATGQAVLVGLR